MGTASNRRTGNSSESQSLGTQPLPPRIFFQDTINAPQTKNAGPAAAPAPIPSAAPPEHQPDRRPMLTINTDLPIDTHDQPSTPHRTPQFFNDDNDHPDLKINELSPALCSLQQGKQRK
jgi:hypothetical protein